MLLQLLAVGMHAWQLRRLRLLLLHSLGLVPSRLPQQQLHDQAGCTCAAAAAAAAW
jgi:hypothetical protein